MTQYGVTNTGFVPKPFNTIYQEREAALKTAFGQDVDTTPESVEGQYIGISANAEKLVWDELAKFVAQLNPDSATGVWLDRLAANNRVTRLGAAPTTGELTLYGDDNTTIPALSQFQDSQTKAVYQTTQEHELSTSSTHDARISVLTVGAGAYTITIDGSPLSYTASGGDSEIAIIGGLVNALTTAGFTVTNNNTNLLIESNDLISVVISNNLLISELGLNVSIEAIENGAIILPAGTITKIQTPVAGLNSVVNKEAGIIGRNRESDAELRLRRARSLRQGIRDAVSQVVGVTKHRVYINNTPETDANGTPRHSIWVVVSGGDNQDIGQAILNRKAAGIGTRGDVVVDAIDPDSEQTTVVRFDRPEPTTPSISINISTESDFPVDGSLRIKDTLINYINGLEIGQPLVYSRLFCPIQQVPGFQVNTLLVDGDSQNLTILPNEVLTLTRNDITVTIT